MRTGSTWLCSLLDSHPEIECKQEIIHRTKYRGSFANSKPYISRCFSGKSGEIKGFKILYHQFRGPNTVASNILINMLREDYKVKVVHLKRNPLEIFISHQLSKRSKLWNVFKGIDGLKCVSDADVSDVKQTMANHNNKITLDLSEAIMFKKKYRYWVDKIEREFKDVITISYDELPDISRICEFLGVRCFESKANTIKLISKPYVDIIENFKEIEKVFVV